MKRQIRKTRITGVVLLGLLASLLLLFVIGPRFSEPAKIRDEATRTLETKTMIDERAAALTTRAKDMAGAQAQMDKLNKLFPSNAALSDLQIAVNAAADSSGLGMSAVTSISTDNPTPVASSSSAASTGTAPAPTPSPSATSNSSAELWQLKVTLQAQGSLTNLSAFVNALYGMDRAFVIDTVAFAKNDTGVLGVTVTGRAFIMQAAATAATPGATTTTTTTGAPATGTAPATTGTATTDPGTAP